jgi:hypothetical protein
MKQLQLTLTAISRVIHTNAYVCELIASLQTLSYIVRLPPT